MNLVLGDFGEAIQFSNPDQTTQLSKGTEYNKSPEMLINTN